MESVTKTAQDELKSGRVEAPAGVLAYLDVVDLDSGLDGVEPVV